MSGVFKVKNPCFVIVEDNKTKEKIIKFLKNKGLNPIDIDTDELIIGESSRIIVADSYYSSGRDDVYLMTEYLTNTIPIDCYKDIELFKAIVEMEDYTDKNQYFSPIDTTIEQIKIGYVYLWKCKTEYFWMMAGDQFDHLGHANWGWFDYTKFRKSTVEEIIEFFKRKNRKLWDQK